MPFPTTPGPTPPFGQPPGVNPFNFDIAALIREFATRGASGLINRSPLGDSGFGDVGGGFDFSRLFQQPSSSSGSFLGGGGLSGFPDLGFLFGESGGGTLSNTLMALQLLQGLQSSQQSGELFSGISTGER